MKKKHKKTHKKTLALIYSRPTSGNIKWSNIESLLKDLGAEISERQGSRIGVKLFGGDPGVSSTSPIT